LTAIISYAILVIRSYITAIASLRSHQMKSTFSDFIKNAPNYNKFEANPQARYIFEDILSEDTNIIAMIDVSESGKPALCACLQQVEDYYREQQIALLDPDLFDLRDNFTKQALGTMVKVVLEPFGYQPNSQKNIPKKYQAKYVKSAMTYEKTGPASMKVVGRIEVNK
jgi:hypothetical protein